MVAITFQESSAIIILNLGEIRNKEPLWFIFLYLGYYIYSDNENIPY